MRVTGKMAGCPGKESKLRAFYILKGGQLEMQGSITLSAVAIGIVFFAVAGPPVCKQVLPEYSVC